MHYILLPTAKPRLPHPQFPLFPPLISSFCSSTPSLLSRQSHPEYTRNVPPTPTGYRPAQKRLSPLQLQILFSHLGEQVFVGFMQSLALHYTERRTVAEYAAEASLSVRHFSTLIHQYTGRTPMQWIHFFTIGQAKHLLQSNMQIKEIADRLGFPEQFTFRKYFKTHTGISPSQYRKVQ